MPKTKFTVDRQNLQVVITREFDAPRELVWKTMTDPKLVPKWWGPAKYETVVDKMDVKVGGQWRFVQKDNGQEYAFSGQYKQIDPPHILSDTFNFEPIGPGHELVETAVLEDLGNGRTKV